MVELLSTLIFGVVAVFLAFRLYSVLGRREGHMEAPQAGDAGRLGQEGHAAMLRPAFEGPAAAGLEAIAGADPGFDPERFIDGARIAYSMISEAFAKGAVETLKPLLSSSVFERYEAAIAQREEKGESYALEIERIAEAEITEAAHADNTAKVTVRFRAEIATETRDKDKTLISGDLGQLNTVREKWTFERRTDSSDPNWVLAGVATS